MEFENRMNVLEVISSLDTVGGAETFAVSLSKALRNLCNLKVVILYNSNNVDLINKLKSSGIEKVAGIHFNPTVFMRNDNFDFYFGASGYFGGESIKYASDLGCDYIVITPTPPYGLVKHYHGLQWESDFIKRSIEMINGFAKVAQEKGVIVSLKNEYWSVFRNQEIYAELDPSILLNIDAANSSIAGQNPAESVKKNISKIGNVHISDTAFIDTDETWKTPLPEYPQHRATQVYKDVGLGNLDLVGFYNTLKSLHFNGWAIISNRQSREPMRALLRSRSWLNKIYSNS